MKIPDLPTQIPELEYSDLEGRYVSIPLFYTNKQWNFWIQTPSGFIKSKAKPGECCYYGDEIANDADIFLEFLDFFGERANYTETAHLVSSLEDDVLNLSASLAKISHFSEIRNPLSIGNRRIYSTEIEYLFSVCRSMYDLLQYAIYKLWTKYIETDTHNKKPLKKKFSDMVLTGKALRTQSDFDAKFKIPAELSAFYIKHAPIFFEIKDFRDSIIHYGQRVDLVTELDEGLVTNIFEPPFNRIYKWKEHEIIRGKYGLLMPAINQVVRSTISACDDFCAMIQTIHNFPARITPAHKVFLSGAFNNFIKTAIVTTA